MKKRPKAPNLTLTMAPMTLGALTLDAQECRDIEDWATEFNESTGAQIPLDPIKWALFNERGINMSLFRVNETVQ